MKKVFFVYILASGKNGTLYVGITANLLERMEAHKNKVNGFTATYDVTKLVYVEKCANADEAIHREKRLKKYKRKQKLTLIEGLNPDWRDLSGDVIENSQIFV